MHQPFHTLRLLLGDQLHEQHHWFKQPDDSVLYVLMEIRPETDYVRHHIQKVVGFFAAMRAFADALSRAGHAVRYFHLDDPDNAQSFAEIRVLAWLIRSGTKWTNKPRRTSWNTPTGSRKT